MGSLYAHGMRLWLTFVALGLTACSTPQRDDAGVDASVSTPVVDSGTAGASDAGAPDAGNRDAGEMGVPPPSTYSPVCNHGWCWQDPSPQGNDLRGVWGSPAGVTWVVGFNGTVLRLINGDWSALDSGTEENLIGVWGTSDSDVWVVGTRGLVRRWNGTTWSTMTAPSGDTLVSVWGTSSTDVWVVEFLNGGVLHWDGNVWARYRVGTQYLYSVSGTAPDDVWVAGSSDVFHWNGSRWTTAVLPSPANPKSVWALAQNDIWVVGDFAFHFDGTRWTKHSTNAGALLAVWGDRANHVYAVGNKAMAVWDGNVWSPIVPNPPFRLWGVGGGSAGAFAVGDYGSMTRLYGATWWSEYQSTGSASSAVWAFSPTNVWVVGDAVLRWNGATWSRVTGPANLTSMWAAAPDNIWATAAPSGLYRWNGSSWTMAPSPSTRPMTLWGVAWNDLWAFTDLGHSFHWDGVAWNDQGALPTGILAAWGSASNDFWAASGFSAFHWDGVSWNQVDAGFPAGTTHKGMGGSSSTDVWLVGLSGRIFHWNGTDWTQTPSGTTSFLQSVWATSPSDAWAVGTGGGVVHWDGTSWSPVDAGTTSSLTDVFALPSGEAWLVGVPTTILHKP